MVPLGSSFFTVPDRSPVPEAVPTVVRLRGQHDVSTDAALCQTLACAIACNGAPLVIDLSEVEFMGASTIGVIVRAREFLRLRSRSLTVRSPSVHARRIIDLCGLDDLLGPSPEGQDDVRGKALGSWVEVPTAERADGQPGQRLGQGAPRRRAQAASVDQFAEIA